MDFSTPGSPPASLVIRLFGLFHAEREGRPLPSPRSRKEEWLLALLILRHKSALDRRWLAGVLWPESEEKWALQNLRRSLSSLRALLGADADRLTTPTPRSLQ